MTTVTRILSSGYKTATKCSLRYVPVIKEICRFACRTAHVSTDEADGDRASDGERASAADH